MDEMCSFLCIVTCQSVTVIDLLKRNKFNIDYFVIKVVQYLKLEGLIAAGHVLKKRSIVIIWLMHKACESLGAFLEKHYCFCHLKIDKSPNDY